MVRWLGLLAVGGSLACAAVGPDYEAPVIKTPEAFTLPSTEAAYVQDLMRWWEVFEDDQLSELIEEVLEANLELAAAVERVVAARQAYAIERSDLFPTFEGTSGYQRTRPFGIFPSATVNQWSAGPNVSWEIDLFGRVRRSIEVAAADLDAQVEDLRGVQIALIAETVSNYLQIRSLQERIAIAAFNVEAQRQSQALTDDRFRAGMTAGLDPAQAEINLFSTRATVPGLKLQLRSAIYRISVLTGRDPLTLLERLEEEQPLPQFPTSLNVGIPADLLRNRPDIRAAERRLASQTALVGVAEARRYPAISLSGAWTWLASTADGLFDSDASETGDIGPAVSIPIFNAGRLRAQVSAEEAGVRQLELSLRALVLEAQEEVENALAAIVFDREQLEMLRGASGAASRAVELSRDLYTAGQSDFQNVLDAERSLFSLQDDVALARLSLLIDVVDLYRSLGGGWARSENDEFDQTADQ